MTPEELQNKNIVLVGMMGAGKSYIGGKLAKLLAHFSYVDIDEKIEKETGLTIPEIFETKGEQEFRDLEAQEIEELSKKRNQIISLGGGAFENKKTIETLKKNCISFYLKAPAAELFKRLQEQGTDNRPLLKEDFSLGSVEKLLAKREKHYQKADFIINTNQKPAYTILNDILKEYENYVK